MRNSHPKEEYIATTFAPEDEHLKAIREKLRADDKEGINVGPSEGRLLQVLLKLVQAKSVVEVGTLYGYSTLWMARALGPEGKIYTFEYDKGNQETAELLLKNSEVANRVEFICGDAEEELQKWAEAHSEKIDVFFIDANKGGYLKYLDVAEKFVRPGGLIIGDNSFLFGHMYGDGQNEISKNQISVMKEFNERLSDPKKYNSVLIPTMEGMTVAQKI